MQRLLRGAAWMVWCKKFSILQFIGIGLKFVCRSSKITHRHQAMQYGTVNIFVLLLHVPKSSHFSTWYYSLPIFVYLLVDWYYLSVYRHLKNSTWNHNLACFVCYVEVINTFFFLNKIHILKKILWETLKWSWPSSSWFNSLHILINLHFTFFNRAFS